jgi:hypothetical protein
MLHQGERPQSSKWPQRAICFFGVARLMAPPPLFFCKCSFQRVLSPMFWKCSFQRVYGRVFGSADSKGVSEWRLVSGGFAKPRVSAPSLYVLTRNFRVATVRPESLISLMWLSYMSEILTCPAITNRSEKPGLPIK